MQIIPVWTGGLNPPSRFKGIKEELQSFAGNSMPLRYFGGVQDGEDIGGLLDDLQEAIDDYMVRP